MAVHTRGPDPWQACQKNFLMEMSPGHLWKVKREETKTEEVFFTQERWPPHISVQVPRLLGHYCVYV